jgi:tRNA threonylcarbamoyladenosine biosynthesis protein TsaB
MMPMLDQLLKRAGVTIDEVDGFAASIGPGSYTGLRIGISAVKTFGFALNKPVYGIETLPAMIDQAFGLEGIVLAMMDARRNRVYVAGVRKGREDRSLVLEQQAMAIPDLIAWIKEQTEPVYVMGDGAEKYEESLKEAAQQVVFLPRGLATPTARTIAWRGLEKLMVGEVGDPDALVPAYLAKTQAERELEERRKNDGN